MHSLFQEALSVIGQCLSSRRFYTALALLSLSTVGTTCIGIATPTPTPSAPTATPPPVSRTPGPSPTPGPPTPTPEPQVLRFGLPAAPVRLDPALSTDDASALVAAQLYETLVRFVPGGTRIEPALATRWAVSPDGLVWEFKLRDGVTFHDGTPLTAQVVLWNFRRWMDSSHPAHTGDFVYWEGMFGSLEEGRGTEEPVQRLVASVEAPDEETFRLILNQPFAPLLHNLAMGAFAILNPETVLSEGAGTYGTKEGPRPVGTGPFRLVDWGDEQVVLEANPDYWEGAAALSQLVFGTIQEDADRFAALQNGEIDGMIAPAMGDLERAGEDARIQVVMDPQPTTAFLNFNLDGEFLGQREVRRAIAYAINKPGLIEKAFGPTWLPATQMLPPSLWGYNETLEDYPYDPERAREILAEVGLPERFAVDLWYPDRPRPYLPDPQAAAEFIAQDLESVGIPVTLDTEHWSAYLVDRRQGAFSMWLLGWTGYNGDPDSFFFYHFGLPTPREGNYVNMDLRELLLRGQVTVDPEAREEIYREAAALIHEDVPRIFLAHPQEPVLLSAEVAGFMPNPAGPESFYDVSVKTP